MKSICSDRRNSHFAAPSCFTAVYRRLWRVVLQLLPACLGLAPASAAPGDWDTSFRPEFPGRVQAAGLQGDEKIIVMAQPHERMDSFPLLRRLRPDGQADRSFNAELDLSGASSGLRIDRILEQPDGKILVSGEFPYARGNAAKGLMRLDASGREDTSFRLAVDSPKLGLLALQPDGKLLAYSRSRDPGPWWSDVITLIRLLPSGEVDASFQPAWPGWKLVGLTDALVSVSGKILVAGHFVGADPETQRRYLLRMESTGAMDPSFDPVLGNPSAGVWPMIPLVLAEQGDGKILVGGYAVAEPPPRLLRRFHANGTEDATFQAEMTGAVSSIHLQADGRILVGDPYAGIPLKRLLPDGANDPEFNAPSMRPLSGDAPTVQAMQDDGALLINGALPGEEPRTTDTFGRLLNSPAVSVLQVTENSTLRWERGGSAPEVGWVTFEARAAGSAEWMHLGVGTRVPGCWELADATLPERGSVRARGFTGRASIAPAEVQWALGGAEPMLAVEFPAGAPPPSGTGVIDCGETWLHRSRATPVVLRNPGDADLRDFSFTVSGPHAADFSVVPTPETVLPPQAAGTFLVKFQPSGDGPRTATLTIAGAGVAAGPLVLALNGHAGSRLSPTYLSPTDIPALPEDFAVAGRTMGDVTLLFEPYPGLSLTVANNLPTTASLVDVPQAAPIAARFGEVTHYFQADYKELFANGLKLRFVAPGAPDIGFQREIPGAFGSSVRTLAEQPDGRLLVGEEPFGLNDPVRTRLTRHFADGTRDPTFTPDLPGSVEALAVQEDGKIIVAGEFSLNGGPINRHVLRLLANGSLDTSFAGAGGGAQVSCLLVQPDGKIVAGGRRWTDGTGWRATLTRLLSDGLPEPGFAPSVATTSFADDQESSVTSLALQSDGKILVGGRFDTVNDLPRAAFARLLPDGSLDTEFKVENFGRVQALAVLADGRIMAAGTAARWPLLRLQPNGDVDTDFLRTVYAPRGGGIHRIVPQADGKLLLAGSFSTLYGSDDRDQHESNGVIRLLADGSIDGSYKTDRLFAPEAQVNDLLIGRDGGIRVGSAVEPSLARLFNDAVLSPLELTDPSTLLWRRAGAQEECSRVEFAAFDAATATWSTLGAGTRTTAGWEWAGTGLPASGAARVRGFLGSGSHGIAEDWLTLGTAAPVLSVEHAEGGSLPSGTGEIAFPPAALWKSPPFITLRLRNSGTGVLAPPTPAVSGPQAGAFAVLNAPTTALGPQQIHELVLAFDPSRGGYHTAQLAVTFPGQTDGAYTLTLLGQGVDTLSPHFDSPATVGDTQSEFLLAGSTFGTLTLGFKPEPGLVLTVLDQTIDRTLNHSTAFDATLFGLPQEGEVTADYAGRTYVFRANYEGGNDGQDLTLSLLGPGMPESGFSPPQPETPIWDNRGGDLYSASMAADHTILIQGRFAENIPRNEARFFHPDGSPLPTAFPLGTPRFDESLLAHALEDGGWLLGSAAPPLVPRVPVRVVRLTKEAVIDPDYSSDVSISLLTSSVLQPDGGLVLTGAFRSDDDAAVGHSVRLLPTGQRDTSFRSDTTTYPWNAAVLGLPNGAILTGERIPDDEGMHVPTLVRLLAHGTRDPSFAIPVTATSDQSNIDCIAMQADGKILVGGSFDRVGGLPRSNFVRLHADGRVDESFALVAAGRVYSTAVQADGKILLIAGGYGHPGFVELPTLTRLMPDGSVDPSFIADANHIMHGIALQADGRILVTGQFTRINQFRRHAFARLLNDSAIETLWVPDAATVRWLRGGSAPETHNVWFDATSDGGLTWTRLGAGARMPSGWELTGLSLPSGGHVRARARVVGGYRNASSSLVESVTVFGRDATALETWRTTHFGTPLSHGAGQDNADPDFDGLPNLLEYALGFDPHLQNKAQAPRWTAHGDHWELRVTPSPAAPGVTCSAEWSPDMQSTSWQPAEDVGHGPEHVFHVPAPSAVGPPTLYVRWRVRSTIDP